MAITFDIFKELHARIKKGDFESDRKLAKEYGINRNCIYQIRRGTHKFFGILGGSMDPAEAIVYPALDDSGIIKKARCKKCGGLCQAEIPCYVCAVRELATKKHAQALANIGL